MKAAILLVGKAFDKILLDKEMMGKVSNKLYPDFLLSEILIKDVLLLNSKTKDYKINEFEGMLFVEDNIKWISLVKNNGAKTK